ncbi:hypothetical protein L5515_013353 [Caenorhabditis briggsae]|uniref:C-type lectin domain-containing protein n=1 Tax=Caenorhabditis briggsae TaxID=6238 RepID=A0AAE9J652_CAEBR|nr:hypothetical protein L5515_013353 [Caenorhabditis briggsae]
MKLVFLAFLFINGTLGTSSTTYKQCGTDINNLWLDIILVIDNSKTMNIDGVYSTIQSIFGPNGIDSPIPIVNELQGATTMANCFCRAGWYQYEWPINSGNLFGICVASLNQNDYQLDARKCYFITSHGSETVGSYYNGLVSQNGGWYWDQPDGMPLLPLDPSSGSVSAKSGCVADVKYSDGSIAWSPISCGNTCDTDFYCF